MIERDQPHNNFFIHQFSNIEFATSYFQEYLPAGMISIMDWNTLHLVPGNFVQKALLNRKSDILYEVKLAENTACLFLHLEHQRTPDPNMPLRIFIYEANIWQQYQKQYPKEPVPLIYPMVLYQGKNRWTAPLSFHDYMNVPEEINDYVPNFRYSLMDLSNIKDEEIQGILIVKVALLIMKFIDSPDFLDYLFEHLLHLMNDLFQSKSGLEYIESVLHYLSKACPNLNRSKVIHEFQKYPQYHEVKEVFMTLYEEAFQKGIEKGIEKGRKEEKKLVALRLLKLGIVTVEQVAQGTGLSTSEIEILMKK